MIQNKLSGIAPGPHMLIAEQPTWGQLLGRPEKVLAGLEAEVLIVDDSENSEDTAGRFGLS